MKTTRRKSIQYAGFTIRKITRASGATAWQVERWDPGTNRLARQAFKTKAAAEGYAERARDERDAIGRQAEQLTPEQRADAVKALVMLAGHTTLQDAAACWVRYHRPPEGTMTFAALVEKYVDDARKRNLRPRSILDLETRLSRMAKDMDVPCTALDTATIDAWLDAQSLTPATRRNFRTVAHGLFAWAMKEHHTPDNPAAGLRRVKVETGMPAVFTPARVEAIMRAAWEKERRAVPYLALAFFAGVRPTELQRLTWGDIDLDAGTVTIRPEVAKKRRSRIIVLADNCRRWLLAARPAPVDASTQILSCYAALRQAMSTIRQIAKVGEWPPDVARHCFGTYHLALHGDISKTCLDMGHTSPNVLFQHYRNLSTKDQAAAFFAILPAAEANAIPFAQAAG